MISALSASHYWSCFRYFSHLVRTTDPFTFGNGRSHPQPAAIMNSLPLVSGPGLGMVSTTMNRPWSVDRDLLHPDNRGLPHLPTTLKRPSRARRACAAAAGCGLPPTRRSRCFLGYNPIQSCSDRVSLPPDRRPVLFPNRRSVLRASSRAFSHGLHERSTSRQGLPSRGRRFGHVGKQYFYQARAARTGRRPDRRQRDSAASSPVLVTAGVLKRFLQAPSQARRSEFASRARRPTHALIPRPAA